MPSSVGAQCGSGVALGASSLVIPLTADIPQSSPTVGVSLLIGTTFWSTVPDTDDSLSDNGATPGTGYSGQPNGAGQAPEANGPGGFLGDGSVWSMGARGYTILNPLSIGDELTFEFGSPIDYFRATVFPVFEVVGGICVPVVDLVGSTGSSDSWSGGSTAVLEQAVTALGDMIEFANLGAFETPGVTDIEFTDGGLTVLDSWVDDGPGNVSYILGYRAITTSDTYDSGGTITGASIPPTDGGIGGVGGNVYVGGVGIGYCPVVGVPLLNTVFPV